MPVNELGRAEVNILINSIIGKIKIKKSSHLHKVMGFQLFFFRPNSECLPQNNLSTFKL